ncbi:MAG: DUF4294 domain-containing protein [Bacteroidales bacterium]|nr:DUF4294 domain-containing protein [Bacteroidales bacterium]
MRCLVAILLFTVLISSTSVASPLAQAGEPTIVRRGRIIDGDTIPHVRLPEVRVRARWKFKSKRAFKQYTRLIYNVKKVLPYARIARERLALIQDSLAKIEDSKLRKKYIKESEDKLFKEFEKPLRKLTISQGRILIKLIDRETGDTSYELIKLLKGRFSAFLWQGVARLFGSSLKSEYDALGNDKAIEYIIEMIDDGVI